MDEKRCNTDTLNFLLFSYFSITLDDSEDTLLKAVIRRAYRDAASRVLHLGIAQDEREVLRDRASGILTEELDQLQESDDYDQWHEALCGKLMDIYGTEQFTCGIAQKWVNMTMKYLYILYGLLPEFSYGKKAHALKARLHVPIDSYILEVVKRQKLFHSRKITYWSTDIKTYGEYMQLQDDLRSDLSALPIEWEGRAWIGIAKEWRKL